MWDYLSTTMEQYLNNISKKYKDPQTSEMGYRTDFENFLDTIFPKEEKYYIHHDAKAVGGNKPDFVVLKDTIPVLYIENKDIGVDLDKIEKSNQMDRYFGYANLILTDQVEFRFYRNGEKYGEPIKIATYDKTSRTISPILENFETLEKTIVDFTLSHKEPIKRGKHLAQIMGGKAQRIRANVLDILEKQEETDIHKVRNTIKKLLVHDMDGNAFADMYAQTLVYGLFVARFYDSSSDSFSRQEARELVPKSNPFLAHFFDHISGVNFEKRLSYIVDELCEVFSHANIPDLMEQYFGKDLWGNEKDGPDPVIHFYEDFLKEYDPELRKKMGAYYTPTPVVRFMVRAVDEILQKEFGFVKGLADTSKYENGLHKVQVLDPATGTGTFISAVIRHIYEKILKSGQKGTWVSYVHNDLLPRIHAFELMMGPYTIAHLKLSMAFEKTGFKYFNNTRLGVYLTNSLEESTQNDLGFGDLGLSGSIAEESKEAGKIKNEKPVMVVIGNPPYSINSENKGEWILKQIEEYKKGLNEKKINIDDDYIKFIRLAQHIIDRNDQGIVAYISNNSFIDGITHRKMRESLLKSFDSVYVLDLHGNARKQETTPEGRKDQNVFDIMQGVSINIFVKTNKIKENDLGKVFHIDLYGERKTKFDFLESNDFGRVKWNELEYSEPYYFFVPKDFSDNVEYEKGFKVDNLFEISNSGVETAKDDTVITYSKQTLEERVLDFVSLNTKDISIKYNINLDKANQIKKDVFREKFSIESIMYRPFDFRNILYSDMSQGIIWRPRFETMKNMFKSNLAIIAKRGFDEDLAMPVFVSNKIIDRRAWSRAGMQGAEQLFPLYLYTDQNEKIPNLNKEIWDKINEIVGKTTPENILDYIYAVLHSPIYREKYKEFLKIDFPRVPYPESKESFFALVELGQKLRGIHLMTDPSVNDFITTFPESGSDEVEKISYKDRKVFINASQYFGNVPEIAWNFYIGGYQPAQKWLKDRKGKVLSNNDIEHYQKMIVALVETDTVMREIDKAK